MVSSDYTRGHRLKFLLKLLFSCFVLYPTNLFLLPILWPLLFNIFFWMLLWGRHSKYREEGRMRETLLAPSPGDRNTTQRHLPPPPKKITTMVIALQETGKCAERTLISCIKGAARKGPWRHYSKKNDSSCHLSWWLHKVQTCHHAKFKPKTELDHFNSNWVVWLIVIPLEKNLTVIMDIQDSLAIQK